jgi:hypothetical protein
VVAEERRLTPARLPRAEDVDPEKLEQRDRDGDGCPEDERADQDPQIQGSSDECGDGHHEDGVLGELREAHEMLVEERVVQRGGPERLEREPYEERAACQPQPAPGT